MNTKHYPVKKTKFGKSFVSNIRNDELTHNVVRFLIKY